MKHIDIPYGRGTMPLDVEENRLQSVILPGALPAGSAPEDIVRQALQFPVGAKRLSEQVQDKQKILMITSDHTRPMPSRVTMPLLLKEIRLGNPKAEITILVATGLHRPTTQNELLERFGQEIVNNERIFIHNAKDAAQMCFFGILPSGGELWLNRLVAEADYVLSEGFIEPHFFAGFSGGRKSILPGVASFETVCYNHNAKFIGDEKARQGVLQGNPIHRDMQFAAETAHLAFILNVLLDENKQIIAAVAGDPETAHLAGCKQCKKICSAQAVSADIVITSNGGYPLDQNIYQSVKGMTAAEACVKPGGAIIMCAALGDGHGGEAFYRWFAERQNADQVIRDIIGTRPEETQADQWQAQILARVMQRAQCWFVTDETNRSAVEAMHMHWAATANEALAQATQALGIHATITVIPNGVSVIL